MGLMGYRTPNIDRVAKEGMIFTDYYAEQSCTAGRASFLTGQHGLRTGLTKVGLPGAKLGLRKEDPTIAELVKPLGYATGQFGKNHVGDRNEFLPTVHGFDEFYGNLYHLNAEEEPELPDYPKALGGDLGIGAPGAGGFHAAEARGPAESPDPVGQSRPDHRDDQGAGRRGNLRQYVRHVQYGQRASHEYLARRGDDPVP